MGGYRGGRVDSCLKGRTGGHRGGWVYGWTGGRVDKNGWTGGRVDKNGWIAQLISTKMLLCFCFCHVVSLSDRYCHLQDLEYVEKSGKKGQRRTSHISQQEKKKKYDDGTDSQSHYLWEIRSVCSWQQISLNIHCHFYIMISH